jgi:hypothetical protein
MILLAASQFNRYAGLAITAMIEENTKAEKLIPAE